jgi:hypothetical protein
MTRAPAFFAIFATAGDIDDRERGIGRRFQKQHFRFRFHRGLPLRYVMAVDQRMSNAETRQHFLDHVAAGAEHRLRRDDMVARAQRAKKRCRHGGHAAGGGACNRRAFQRGHARLEHRHGRIAEARIGKAVGAFETRFGFFGGLVSVARRSGTALRPSPGIRFASGRRARPACARAICRAFCSSPFAGSSM